jgi:hypothetical protein
MNALSRRGALGYSVSGRVSGSNDGYKNKHVQRYRSRKVINQ